MNTRRTSHQNTVLSTLVLGLALWCGAQGANAGVVLDGVDDYSSSTASATVSGITGLTVAGWVNVASFTNNEVLLALGTYDDAANYAFVLRINSATQVRWGLSNGTVDTVWNATVSTLPTATWFHLAATWDGTTIRLYVNGVQQDSTTTNVPSTLNPLSATLYAGTEGRLIGFANATLMNLGYWPVVLSQNEIESLALAKLMFLSIRNGSGTWPMDECPEGASADGVTWNDRAGAGRSLIGNNGANNTGLTCQGSNVLSYPWGAN